MNHGLAEQHSYFDILSSSYINRSRFLEMPIELRYDIYRQLKDDQPRHHPF